MVTTIQVNEKTIILLKKIKNELGASSYDDAINKIAKRCLKPEKSMASSLRRYVKELSKEEILKNLKEKNDRL
jgi:heme oxygenase